MAVLLLVGCAPVQKTHGQLARAEDLAELKVGESTKAQVTEIMGSPTTIANFDPDTWIYIGLQTEGYAFEQAEIKQQLVLVLTFDEQGVLIRQRILDANDRREIAVIERETPTYGRDSSFLMELFGNIGRFTPSQ